MSAATMWMTLSALASAAASGRLPIAIVSERAEVIASVRAAAAIAHLPAVVVASADLATVLEPTRFSWLALADAPALPADAAPAYMRFAEAGRGLVLLGGKPPRLNASHAQLMINVMSTYEPYVLTNESITRVRALTEGSGKLGGGPVEEIVAGSYCTALSAVGWHVPNIVQFVPLLESLDVHSRYTGWALSTTAPPEESPVLCGGGGSESPACADATKGGAQNDAYAFQLSVQKLGG